MTHFFGSSDTISLKRAYRRAKEAYGKEGPPKLAKCLSERTIKAFAKTTVVETSSECYEFSNQKLALIHRDDVYKQREVNAWNLAFGLTIQPNPETFHVEVLNISRFVFVDIAVDQQLLNTQIPVPFKAHNFDINLDPDFDRLKFKSIQKPEDEDYGISESRYFRNITFRRFTSEGVALLQSDVDAVFPYSSDTPSREAPGRPTAYPAVEPHAYLSAFYANKPRPRLTEAVGLLFDWYAAQKKYPSDSTVKNIARQWLKNTPPETDKVKN